MTSMGVVRDTKKGTLTVFKITVYVITVFVLALVQTNVLPRFAFFGVTPSVLLAMTATVAFFDGEKPALIVGLISGFLLDAFGGTDISILPLAYTAIGWFISFAATRFGHTSITQFGPKMFWCSAWTGVASVLGAVVTALLILLTAGRVNVLSAARHIIIPEAFGTFAVGILIGFTVNLIQYKKRGIR